MKSITYVFFAPLSAVTVIVCVLSDSTLSTRCEASAFVNVTCGIVLTPSGSVISVGCRADKASRNRAYLYFTIRDNDSKLAGDLMQGMFEMKDERDDPLRAGLYIAREIISTMGGNVRVRSRRGEGTEFMVTVIMKLP